MLCIETNMCCNPNIGMILIAAHMCEKEYAQLWAYDVPILPTLISFISHYLPPGALYSMRTTWCKIKWLTQYKWWHIFLVLVSSKGLPTKYISVYKQETTEVFCINAIPAIRHLTTIWTLRYSGSATNVGPQAFHSPVKWNDGMNI